MNSLRTKQLLLNAAREFKRDVESFSRTEISKQINQIKYLSAQKKVPKLTLRKEIIHLENKLKSVLELEKELARKKSKESSKITSLKRQVTSLKNKLHASEDKDLSKKVEKLSHLLGDYLAKCGTEKDIALSRKLIKEIQSEIKEPKKRPTADEISARKEEEQKETNTQLIQKAESMQVRLNSLKHEIAIHKELETKSPEEIKNIESKVELIQQKLKEFYAKHPEITEIDVLEDIPGERTVKHKMLFEPGKPDEEDRGMEKILPLPPPPRIEE